MRRRLILAGLLCSWRAFGSDFVSFDIGRDHIRLPLFDVSDEDNNRLLNPDKSVFDYYIPKATRSQSSLRQQMTPVRSQGARGTCSVFAALGLIEFYNRGNLSEQCLAKFSSDNDRGWINQRITWAVNNGLYNESDCQYDKSEGGRNHIPDLSQANKVWPGGGYTSITQEISDPIAYIKRKIDDGGAVGISIYVAGHDWSKNKIIGVPTDEEIRETCGEDKANSTDYKKCGGHAVVVTGYNDHEGYLEFKNSWDWWWGDGGYGKMSYSYYLKMKMGFGKLVSK